MVVTPTAGTGETEDAHSLSALSTLTPYRWPLREREDAGKCLQKRTSPLHRNNGFPIGSAGAAPGGLDAREAWLQHFSVRADSVKNTHSSNDCEPKHFTISFCFFPSKVVRQPFFSCTIGLNIQIFFCNILSCQIKKIYYGSLFLFFFFLFPNSLTKRYIKSL